MIGIIAASDLPADLERGGISPVLLVFLFLLTVIGAFGYYVYQENLKRATSSEGKVKKVSKKKLNRERRELRSQPLE